MALEQALPEQTPCQGWHPLTGGRTNAAWRGECENGDDIVLKLYAGAALNPLFPNNPGAEAALLQFLERRRMVPAFLASFDTLAGRCNVYTHVPGTTWRRDTPTVARLMRRLHVLDRPDGLRQVADGSAALLEQILGIVGKCGVMPDFLSHLPRAAVLPSGASALLHSDIVPGNLIENVDGLHLIDWQCPAVGDPCEDIAVFLSPAMQQVYRGNPLSEQEIAAFLIAYDDAKVAARYKALAPFYHARMAAYCLWQFENGRQDYGTGLRLEVAALQRSLRP
ncbi:phosphotransferase family protein [Shimia sp.]|uniref:phosphotransferase family protein n=1 Tax=Shimia sp. TaxID=1954381 RepID=UPI003B8BE21F